MTESSSAWKCVVCGYVHRGNTAPEVCPICGASTTDFEVYEEALPIAQARTRQWRCLICGYEHDGDSPPDTCPVCGAGSDEFEARTITSVQTISNDDRRKVVIVGAGIAGVSAAESVRQTLPHAEILLVSAEEDLPYYRLNLTRRLAGELSDDELIIHAPSWYEEHGIILRTGVSATSLEPENHTISLDDGESVTFDKLILACGAHPFIPPIPGADMHGVSAIRTLNDVHRLLDHIDNNGPCVCVGGGILGLETAGALAKHGLTVTLLEGFDYLLPRQLNRDAARVLETHIQSLGITIRTHAVTKAIEGNGVAQSVLLEDGLRLPAVVVTITTGVRANTHLARRAGLQVNQGIVVDDHMATSHPDIFTAGDCAEYAGTVAGLWEPAQYQGMIAGLNAASANAEFGGIPRMNTLKVLGIKLFSMGIIQPDDGSYTVIAKEQDGVYRRFLFRDSILVGTILVGDTRLAAASTRVAREHTDCSCLMGDSASVDEVDAFLVRMG